MVSGEVHNEGQIKAMAISTKWTWINFILSIIGSVSGYIANELGFKTTYRFHYFDILLAFLPTFVPAAICLAILFCSKELCSSCCNVNLPIVYKTGVSINDFSHIIDLQTGLEYGVNENEETESNCLQLDAIISSGHTLERQQMQIETLNLQVETMNMQIETLTTQVSELREKLQVLIENK